MGALSKKQQSVLRVALVKLVLAKDRPRSPDYMVDSAGRCWTTVHARSATFRSLYDRGLIRYQSNTTTNHRAWVTLTKAGWEYVEEQRWTSPVERPASVEATA